MNDFFFQESTPVPGRRYEAADGATIGRGNADFVLVDPQVSRVHAKMHVDQAGVRIEDLGSRNGTFVNEIRIDAETELREGDTVRMGDTVWRFFAEAAASVRAGDVPAPDPVPSGIREAPLPDPARPPDFAEPHARPARRRGSAARNVTATILSYAVVIATALAVALYLVLR
jgi:predicted component of type VI protein secretion system